MTTTASRGTDQAKRPVEDQFGSLLIIIIAALVFASGQGRAAAATVLKYVQNPSVVTQKLDTSTAKAKPKLAKPKVAVPVGPNLPAHCRAQLGGARIVCAAELADDYGYLYGGSHRGQGQIAAWKAVSGLGSASVRKLAGTNHIGLRVVDCSSLVAMAEYGAYGVKENRVVQDYQYSPNWKRISLANVQTGDALVKDDSIDKHIALVVKPLGTNMARAFDAETQYNAPVDQIRYYTYHLNYFTYALRWVGPGAVK